MLGSETVRRLCLMITLVLVGLGGVGAMSHAMAAPKLDVTVERGAPDKSRPNYVSIVVTVRNAHTKKPIDGDFSVYAVGRSAAGEQTDPNGCAGRSLNQQTPAPGVYDCTVIVDHGGVWTFIAVVNSLGSELDVTNDDADELVELGRGQATFRVDASALRGFNQERESLEASAGEVLILQGHVIIAAAWALSAALLAAIAVPWLRRLLSTASIHVIEMRYRLLQTTMWVSCLLTVATGVVLLLNLTPYETPFTPVDARVTLRLPFGREYFMTMAVKLAVFAVMVVATTVIARAAGKCARMPTDVAVREPDDLADEPDPWGGTDRDAAPAAPPGGMTSVVAAIKRPESEQLHTYSAAPVTAATVVLAAGLAIVGFCVTLLKYFHEMIEAAKAFVG